MRRNREESWRERKTHRSQDGLEYYNYPSALSLKYWYHVYSLGRAYIRPGPRSKVMPKEGFLLHYVRRGAVRHSIHGRRHDAGSGSVCLMDYSEENEHEAIEPKAAEVWWAHFGGRDLPHLFTELRADREPVFHLVDTKRFEALFRELIRLIRTRPRAYEAKSFAMLAALMAELFASRAEREYQVSLIARKAVLSEPIRKGIDYMVRFYSGSGLGLKAICCAAGLSLRHFTRLFRSEVGMTPIQYLNRYRVEQAKQLLLSNDKTMEQVARLVGASNQSYFSYLFRKETGTTPREYQARALRRAARI